MTAHLTLFETAFALLIAFQIKHFLGDYILQTGWMARGKSEAGLGFVLPLFTHSIVHAALTMAIILVVEPQLWYLALLDFAVHFVLDRVKSSPLLLGRFGDADKRSYWIPLGLDQMAHHLTHYAIIYLILIGRAS